MRSLVRGIQICLILVFFYEAITPLIGILSMTLRTSVITSFEPSPVAIVQTKLGVSGAIAHFFSAFHRLAVVALLEFLWAFHRRVEAAKSYQARKLNYR